MTKVFKFLFLITFISCGSVSIKVSSTPEKADVYVSSMGAKTREKIGTTPFVITAQELEKKKIKSGPIIVELRKEGYLNTSVLLTETNATNIDLSLSMDPRDKVIEAQAYDKYTSDLFEAQRLTRAKNYEDALKKLGELKKSFPQISVADEMEGTVYYLQKDFKKSLEAFNSAYAKNPQNDFALRMRKILEAKIKAGQ